MRARVEASAVTLIAAALGAAVVLMAAGLLWRGATPGEELALELGAAFLASAAGIGVVRLAGRAAALERRVSRLSAREQSVLDGSGEAVIVIDDQATIVRINRAAEQMFGYEAADLVGTSLERLMTDGARQAHAAYLAHHGVTAMVEAVQLRHVHKGVRKRGEVFPFELTMTEWRDGERRMFTGVMRDVSDRVRAATALRESEARFTGLYENSAELIFIYAVQPDGGFALEGMNPAAEAYTGCSRDAVAGSTPDELADPAEAKALKRALLRCLEGSTGFAQAVRLKTQGSVRTLHLTFSPMRAGSGEITRVLARATAPVAPAELAAAS